MYILKSGCFWISYHLSQRCLSKSSISSHAQQMLMQRLLDIRLANTDLARSSSHVVVKLSPAIEVDCDRELPSWHLHTWPDWCILLLPWTAMQTTILSSIHMAKPVRHDTLSQARYMKPGRQTSRSGGFTGNRALLSRKSAVASVALMMISFRGTALPCWASLRRRGTMRESRPAQLQALKFCVGFQYDENKLSSTHSPPRSCQRHCIACMHKVVACSGLPVCFSM